MIKIWAIYKGYIFLPTSHRSELISIQWLRGIAVMMVFVYHMEDVLNLLPNFGDFRSIWKSYGYSAPDLFFVISGFIMCFVTFELKFKPIGWIVRRFLRIYPIFMLFASVAIAVWIYDSEMTMGSGVQTWESVSKFFLLLPQEKLPLLFVAWTLEHEIVFYSVVFFVTLAKGTPKTVVIVTGILSVMALIKVLFHEAFPILNFWDYHFLSLYMFQFFLGSLLFLMHDKLSKLNVKYLFSAGIILFIISGLVCKPAPLNEEHVSKVLMFGICYSLIILGAINLEKIKRIKINGYIEYKFRPFLVQMGDASYSIYLSHPFLFSICGKIIIASGITGIKAIMALLLGSAISLFLGTIIYHLLEKPIIHASKAWCKKI